MSIKGITFDNQVPTAKSHRAVFASALTDGILAGCSISYSGFTVTVGSGFVSCGGGVAQLTAGEAVVIPETVTGYVRIKGVIDLSKASTAEEFSQFRIETDNATSLAGLPELTQDDINSGTGTTYECEIAVLAVGSTGVTSLARTAHAVPKLPLYDALPETCDRAAGEVIFVRSE